MPNGNYGQRYGGSMLTAALLEALKGFTTGVTGRYFGREQEEAKKKERINKLAQALIEARYKAGERPYIPGVPGVPAKPITEIPTPTLPGIAPTKIEVPEVPVAPEREATAEELLSKKPVAWKRLPTVMTPAQQATKEYREDLMRFRREAAAKAVPNTIIQAISLAKGQLQLAKQYQNRADSYIIEGNEELAAQNRLEADKATMTADSYFQQIAPDVGKLGLETKQFIIEEVPIEKQTLFGLLPSRIEIQKQVVPKGTVTKKVGTRENPARPTTQMEFDALSKGTYFINPIDGKLKQK